MNYFKLIRDNFNKPGDVKPPITLPSIKTDLKSIRSDKPVIVWFGHSSYFIHVKGVNILVDPVFSGHASPLPFMIKAFPGSDIYTIDDMPHIDILVLTHNHYDHLDIKTIIKLKQKVDRYYTPLGVGTLLEKSFLYDKNVSELD